MVSVSASLPMYDLPEMARANADFWRALRERLVEHGLDVGACALSTAPAADPDRWPANLIFTQGCGYPLFKYHRGDGDVLATPCYAMAGCEGPYHRAIFVVRADDRATRLEDVRGRVFGCNSLRSNTGMNLPRLALARIADGQRVFARVVVTGGHLRSLEALVAGHIDACAIDCVTWGFLARFRPALTAQARILAETARSPCLPFATSAATRPPDRAILQRALGEIAADPRQADIRSALALADVVQLEESAYETLLHYERQAAALGYPELV